MVKALEMVGRPLRSRSTFLFKFLPLTSLSQSLCTAQHPSSSHLHHEPALLDLDISSSDSDSPHSDSLLPPFSQVLRACLRNPRSRNLARVREQGRIPAVLVDPEKSRGSSSDSKDLYLSFESKPIVKLVKMFGKRDFLTRVFEMEIYKRPDFLELRETLQVLPRNLNYGSGKTNLLNMQLLRAPADKCIKLGVPIEFLGQENCPGLRKGGVLKKLAKFVLYKCKATELPAKVVVDMSVLEIGDRVVVQDLEVDFDLLESDRLMPVCEIIKDASTQKWKLKRQKNELFFKRKAFAENEAGKHSVTRASDKEPQVSDEEEVEEDVEDDCELPKRLKKFSEEVQSSVRRPSPENARKNRNVSRRRLVGSRVSRKETNTMLKLKATGIGKNPQKKDSTSTNKSASKHPKKTPGKTGVVKKR